MPAFETMYGSAGWRTYLALHATVMSLAEGELRQQVQVALAASERDRTTRVAQAWEQLTALFGYRLRPELGSTFEAMATLLGASLHGLIMMALSTPDIASHRSQARPSGAAMTHEWSLAALGVVGIASTFLEPDPAVDWDDARRTMIRQALDAWTPPPTSGETS